MLFSYLQLCRHMWLVRVNRARVRCAMASTPPESPEPADPHDAWNKLVKLNRMMIRQSGLTLPTLSAEQSPEPAPGAPPTVLALAAEIDKEIALTCTGIALASFPARRRIPVAYGW